MRTTLKRGIGRGATLNGDGRVVLPPGPLTRVTKYRQPLPPRPTGLRLVGRILLWLVALLVMVAGGLAGGAYLFFHESIAAIRAHSEGTRVAQNDLADVPPPDKAAIALVVGYDRRAGDAAADPSRSDTVMLLRADPQLKAVSMLSFPRDMVVDIHCPGRATYQDRINAAYSSCGVRGTLATVKALIGLPVNYLITVNFDGFRRIVDNLDGVWIDVDRRYLNTNEGRYETFAEINLWPGYQRLRGWQALDYARYRHTDSDLFRVIRQQQVVTSLKHQVHANFDVGSVPKIIDAIRKNVEVGTKGGDLHGKTVYSYGKFLYNLPGGHFFQAKVEGLEGQFQLYTDPSNVTKAVYDFTHPDVDAPRDATDVIIRGKPRVPRTEDTTVAVLNGNGREGAATQAAEQLANRGYQIKLPPDGLPANAPRFDYGDSIVYFNPRIQGARLAAGPLERLFEPALRKPLPPTLVAASNGAMNVVIVGSTFHGTLAPAPERKVPKPQPPAVVTNPDASLPYVRSAVRKVPFQLMLPTKIEQTSAPDSEVPVRVYPLNKKHKTVRLTYRTGNLEYWGVQMTDWEDAPVLAEKNFRRFIKGRVYDLYFSGSHLHMVVLREKGATYWVVNTLNDSLSNETMLAIARGLKPYGKPRRR